MKEYICKKDFYLEDVKFASKGHKVVLLQDNRTVVNVSMGQKVINYPEIVKNTEYFAKTFETAHENPTPLSNAVNHPDHYTWLKDKCGIEVIDITRHLDFNTGNAIKYLLRSGYKKEEGLTEKEKAIQDLQKAVWYIQDKIKSLEK